LPNPHRLNNPTGKLLRFPSLGLMVTIPVIGILMPKSTSKCTSWSPLFGSASLKCISMVLRPFGTGLCKFPIDHGMISVLKFMTVLIAIGTSPYPPTIPCDTNLYSLRLSIPIH
jgi:hypothetical protein